MVVVAGEFVCTSLQVVHLFLVAFQTAPKSRRFICILEVAILVHLALALILTVGAGLIGAPVLARALESFSALGVLWVNAFFAAWAFALAIRARRVDFMLDALFMTLCTPMAITLFGAFWNLVALLDITWFLFRGLSGISRDLVRRSEGLSELSTAEALTGMPAGILVIGPAGGSTFMNVRMRECLSTLALPCDLGDQTQLWTRLSEIGRNLADEANFLGVPETMTEDKDRLLVNLPDGKICLFVQDTTGGHRPSKMIVCLDITEVAHANAALAKTNRELEKAADELRTRLADIERVAQASAYLSMRSRVHDVVGQRLSILHRYLEMGMTDPASVAELERLLSSVMVDLRRDAETDASAELEAIVEAFALVGVTVEIDGELPDGNNGVAFTRVIREACTNSCWHAHAKRIFVEMKRTGDSVQIVITDDGESHPQPLIERGGITGMRRAITSLNGTLNVGWEPMFTVRAEIPVSSTTQARDNNADSVVAPDGADCMEGNRQ
jgi:signal transduction histidine kinase